MPGLPSAWRRTSGVAAIDQLTKSKLNTALTRITTPNRPPMRPHCFEFIWSAPAVRLDRAIGREQAEYDDREEVDDVLQVDGALAEGIEVAHAGEIGDEVAHPALGLARGPADD